MFERFVVRDDGIHAHAFARTHLTHTHTHTHTPFLRIYIIFAQNHGKLVFAILILDLGLFGG
jgi:hypothetical protein